MKGERERQIALARESIRRVQDALDVGRLQDARRLAKGAEWFIQQALEAQEEKAS